MRNPTVTKTIRPSSSPRRSFNFVFWILIIGVIIGSALGGTATYFASQYIFGLKVESIVKDFQIAAVANSCGFMDDKSGFKWKLQTGAGHMASTNPVSALCFVSESKKECEARVAKIAGAK